MSVFLALWFFTILLKPLEAELNGTVEVAIPKRVALSTSVVLTETTSPTSFSTVAHRVY